MNGLVAATIAVLQDAGWTPQAADSWIGPQGQEYMWNYAHPPNLADRRDMADTVCDDVLRCICKGAENHRHGQGRGEAACQT